MLRWSSVVMNKSHTPSTGRDRYDVIIAGGGPAGSACATILARNGIRVLVCEKKHFPRHKVCGECINPRSWGLLQLLGVDDIVRRQSSRCIKQIEISSNDGKKIGVSLDDRRIPFIALPRAEFDSILARNAIEQGAEVLEGMKVEQVYHEGVWHVVGGGNHRGEWSAPYLVGADGRNSIVARSLSALPRRSRRRLPNRVGIQWHTEFQRALGNTLAMFLFPDGYCGAVNVSRSMANIAMVTSGRLVHLAQTDWNRFLETTVLANPSARELLASVQPIRRPATAFPIDPTVSRSNHPSAFLLGDARRTVEPFTGEGIFFALQDGISTGVMLSNRILGSDAQFNLERQPSWVESALSFSLRHPRFGEAVVTASLHASVMRKHLIRAILGTNPGP